MKWPFSLNTVTGVKENKEVILLLLAFFVVQLFLISAYPRTIGWDESVYMGMGKYIYSAGNVGLWEDIRPAGLPLVLGLLWSVGVPLISWAQLLLLLFAVGVLSLVYLMGRRIGNKAIGVYAALLLAITPVFFFYASYVLPHIPATFFALLGLWLFSKEKYFHAGFLASIAFLFRFPQGLIFAAFFASIFFIKDTPGKPPKKEKFLALIGGFVIPLIPFFIANYFLYQGTAIDTIHALFDPFLFAVKEQANLHYAVQGMWENLFFYPIELIMQNFLLVFSIVALFFYLKEKAYKTEEIGLLNDTGAAKTTLLLLLLFIFVYYTIIINKQIRFSLEFLPYLSLFAGRGLHQFLTTPPIRKRKGMFLVLSLIIAITIAALAFSDAQKGRLQSKELEEFYSFPQLLNGTFLTTLPEPAAYTDRLFIPIYANVPATIAGYGQEKANASYFLWYAEFSPCLDTTCQQTKDAFFKQVTTENMVISDKKINNQEYAVIRIAE